MLKNRFLPIPQENKEVFRQFAEQITGWQVKDTHIKKIKVHAFSNRIKRLIDSDISVGEEIDSNLSNGFHESVMAIFESQNEYLVVTPLKNSAHGTVYLFDPQEVLEVTKEEASS